MKGFKQRVSTFKWKTVIWKGEKFKTPFLDNDSYFCDRSDISRFSKFRDDVVQMFLDFCDRHSLKISLVEEQPEGGYLLTSMSNKDIKALAQNYQAASLALSAEECVEVWNGNLNSFQGVEDEYSMLLHDFDKKTGEETTAWVIAIDFRGLTTFVSQAMACL